MSGEVAELRMFDNRTPESVIAEAQERYGPFVYRLCAFSGGHDSLTVAHRCRDDYDALMWADTGTAIPGVREHIEQCAAWLEKPLLIYEQPGAYREIVLGGVGPSGTILPGIGMPGYGQHSRCYNRLKERSFEAVLRDLKVGHPRSARVLTLSGIRNSESQRRAGRWPITKKGAMVWCNPIIEWSSRDVRDYREEHGLPESDVAALLHRSGECNCGAYAKPGEREELRSLWPEWFDKTILPLEQAAEAEGMRWFKWGYTPNDGTPQEDQPACSDCQLRIDVDTATPNSESNQ